MAKAMAFCKFCWLKLQSYFPTALPKGMAEFESWAQKVYILSGKLIKYEHMKFVLATQIIHMDAKTSKVPMNVFVRLTHKAAANQIASAVFQDIKTQQQEEAKKAAQQEATALAEASIDEQTTQGS
jgi:hypothetical protein